MSRLNENDATLARWLQYSSRLPWGDSEQRECWLCDHFSDENSQCSKIVNEFEDQSPFVRDGEMIWNKTIYKKNKNASICIEYQPVMLSGWCFVTRQSFPYLPFYKWDFFSWLGNDLFPVINKESVPIGNKLLSEWEQAEVRARQLYFQRNEV